VSRGGGVAVAAEPLPDHIVNGDFEYPNIGEGNRWTLVRRDNDTWYDCMKWAGGQCYMNNGSGAHWESMPGFDPSRFGWRSTQTSTRDIFGGEQGAGAVELQRWRGTGYGQYAELVESQAGTSIYQDIDTQSSTPVVYHVSLKHSPSAPSSPIKGNWNTDKMQVLIGVPGREQPVMMTRMTNNGHNNGMDKVGETNTIVSTTSDIAWAWETYQGNIVIPANQPVTRFTFRSVQSPTDDTGNRLDDIVFTKAYPLHYDMNGGADTSGKLR
jgi:hypothetical protein